MFKITGKKNGIVWDKAKKKMLAKFKDGIFETEDKGMAKSLKDRGFEVEEIKDGPVEEPEQ